MTSQKQSQVTNEILHGNLVKLMFKLSTPGILGMMLISSSTFVDALFAGQFIGQTAIAGISLASPLSSIIGGFALLVGVGSASVLSRAMGSGDIKIQSQVFGNLIVMSVGISLIITSSGYSFSEELIGFMGGSGEVVSAGADFFKTYVLGSVFLILAIASSQLIKAEGRIRLASIFASVFVIINLILNFIFIRIFTWGLRGLALATVMAMIVYSIVNLTYFLSGKSSIPVNPQKFVLEKELLPDILSVGISALLIPVLSSIQTFIVLKSISHYGTQNDIAFFGAAQVLTSVAFIILNGFVQALQPVIGINYGARNYERLKKAYLTFVIGGTVFLTLLWIPLQVYPEIFLGWLLPDVTFTNKDLFNFRILSLSIPIMPLALSGITLFQSTGKGKTVIIIVLLRNLILFAPIVVASSMLMGVQGIYYGMFVTDILVVLIISLLNIREFKHLSQMQIEKHQL